MFSLFSAAIYEIKNRPMEIDYKKIPRMVDYARFGYHIAKVLGYKQEDYELGLRVNQKNQNTKGLESSPAGEMTAAWIDTLQRELTITIGDMHSRIKEFALAKGYEVGGRSGQFPSTIQKYAYELRKVLDDLDDIGYKIEKQNRVSSGVKYLIKPMEKHYANEDYYMDIADKEVEGGQVEIKF